MEMEFEEALSTPGVVAAWDGAPSDGLLTLSVFAFSPGVRQVSWRGFPVAEVTRIGEELRARGVPVGGYDFHCEQLWLAEPDAFRLWAKGGATLVAEGDRLTYGEGQTLARSEIHAVEAFVDGAGVRRGIAAVVRGGGDEGLLEERILLVVERSTAALSSSDYDRDEQQRDSAWTLRLAEALGHWLGVPSRPLRAPHRGAGI